MRLKRWVGNILGLLAFSGLVVSCGAGHFDMSTLEGRTAILDAVNIALSHGDCRKAIILIDPLYFSEYTGNDVRMARASAYACASGVDNFFGLADRLSGASFEAGPGEGSFLFRTAVELFHSSDNSVLDDRITASGSSMEALMSAIRPEALVNSKHVFLNDTANPGSTYAPDRTDDSNLYMMLVGLSAMGAVEARYGAPYPSSWKKGQDLPFAMPATIPGSGCTYVAGLLNFLDSAEVIMPKLSGSLSAALPLVQGMKTLLDTECAKGCVGTGAVDTGCRIASGCDGCPMALRDPGSCTGAVSNAASCAAAGAVQFINDHPIFGWADGP